MVVYQRPKMTLEFVVGVLAGWLAVSGRQGLALQ
jgi:hypothetical protein